VLKHVRSFILVMNRIFLSSFVGRRTGLRMCNCTTNIKKFNLFYTRYRFWTGLGAKVTSSVLNCIKQHDRKRHTRAATDHIRRRAAICLNGQFFFCNTRCSTHIRHYQHINTYLIVLVPRQDFTWYPFIKPTCTNHIRWSVVQASWVENAVRQKFLEETCYINIADTFLDISYLFYMSTEMPKKLRMTLIKFWAGRTEQSHTMSYDLRRRRRPWQN
jgi:hypothetical protein